LTDFRKIFKYQISRKTFQSGPSCSMWTDGRTDGCADMTQLKAAFRNFDNTPKNQHGLPYTDFGLSLCKVGLKTPEVW